MKKSLFFKASNWAAILISNLTIFLFFGTLSSRDLTVVEYDIYDEGIPPQFDNFVIAHISDLHNKSFGENHSQLIGLVKNINPSVTVLTGDIIDRRAKDYKEVRSLLNQLVDLSSVLLVYGNHEVDFFEARKNATEIDKKFGTPEISLLKNESIEIFKGNASINFFGFDETGLKGKRVEDHLQSNVSPGKTGKYNILLYHRGNDFDYLKKYGYQLILSGHVHGGIVRLPLIGGVFSTELSLFPKYDGGMYTAGQSTMVLSRGLGDHLFIPRIYNPPEIVVVRLHSKQSK